MIGVQEIRVNAINIDNPIIFFISGVLLNLTLLTDSSITQIKKSKLNLTSKVKN